MYFDHNATTPLDERVLEAVLPFLKNVYGNPSSTHRLGRIVKSAIDIAREQVAALVDVSASQIIFTSGGTEANNLALHNANGRTAVSAIEHPCVLETFFLRSQREIMEVNQNGIVELSEIMRVLEKKTQFISIMLANNETGVIQPIADYAKLCAERNVIFHTDAVQALGKIPVSFKNLGVSMMSLSSHKIYGMKGCGALIFDKKLTLKPLLLGGGQEQNYRSGTENVAGIVGFGKAAEIAKTELEMNALHLLTLQKLLETQLLALSPRIHIFAQNAERLPNTTLFGIDGIDGELILLKLDQKGVALSSGSACASAGQEPSHVLTAMGVSVEKAKSAIRVSLGKQNTKEDILKFIELLKPWVNQ